MVESWDKAKELVGMVEEDPNYYLEVQEKSMNSIQSHMDTLKATMQDFWYNFLNQDAINSGLSALNSVAETLTGITKTAQSLPAIGDTLSMALLGTGAVGIPALIDNIWKSRQDMKKNGESYGLFGGIGRGTSQTLKELSQLGMSDNAIGKDGKTFDAIKTYGSLFGAFKTGFGEAKEAGSGFFKSMGSGAKTLWGSLSGLGKVVTGLGAAFLGIEVVTKVFDALVTSTKESQEKVSKLTAEIDNQNSSYKTANDLVQNYGAEWAELSKGVRPSGENVFLSEQDFKRYQELSNQIAESFPSLVSSFDADGNAILNVAGSVKELNEALVELSITNSNKNLQGIGDIEENFKNMTKNRGAWTEFADGALDQLGAMVRLNPAEIGKSISYKEGLDALKDMQGKTFAEMKESLSGYDDFYKTYFDSIGLSANTAVDKFSEVNSNIRSEIGKYTAIIEEAASPLRQMYQDTANILANPNGKDMAFKFDAQAFNDINTFLSKLPVDKLEDLQSKNISVSEFVGSLLGGFEKNASAQEYLNELINLQNGGSLQDIIEFANSSKLDYLDQYMDNVSKDDLIEMFDLKNVGEMSDVYDDIIEKSKKFEKEQKKGNKQIKSGKELMDEFLESREITSLDDLKALQDIIDDVDSMDDLEMEFTIDSFDVDALDEKLGMLKENIGEVEAAFTLMNDAMAESNSARGLSVEKAEAIANQFSWLKGFDYDKLFESTSSGNHLNGEYFEQLQKQFADVEIDKYSSQVEKWQEEYQDLCVAIAKAGTAEEKRQNIEKRDTLSEKINKAREYQSQIEGITNAVNLWQQAEARGDEGDLYDDVVNGLEGAKEMFKEGLIGDDGFQAFTQMFSNQDLSGLGSDKIAEIFQAKLPQMESWLQEGSVGVNNFIKDVAKLNEGLIDAQGNVNFDAMPDVETLANQLGVSESLIDTMFKKLNQYGADIDFSEAADNLRSLRQEAVETGNALDEATREQYSVNLDADGKDAIQEQIDAAEKLKESVDDDSDAYNYLEDQIKYLQARLGEIESPDIDVNTPQGLEQIEAAIDEINDKADVEISIDWTSEDPSYYEDQIEELEGAIENLDANGDGTISLDTEGGQAALDLLIELEQKAFETGNTNISMAVDTSQLEGNTATMVSKFAEIQNAATTLNSYLHAQDLGIDVSDDQVNAARDNLANLISEFQTAHGETAEALDITADVGDTSALDAMSQRVTELTGKEYAVKLGVDENQINGLDDVNISVNVTGNEEVQQLKQDINDVPKTTNANVYVDVTGEEKVSTLKTQINQINNTKNVSVSATVSGGDQVTNLKTNLSTLPPAKTTSVGANVTGQQDVSLLKTTINDLQSRSVTETATTIGYEGVASLKSTIDGLSSKTITITTNYVQNGEPSSVHGNAHAQGNANSIFAKGRALAHGVWGATKDSMSLVGELGR